LLYAVLTSAAPKAGPAMQSLLRHGIDPRLKTEPGASPIIATAFLMHNVDVESILRDAGADPWAHSGPDSTAGDVPALTTAFNLLDFKTIDLLLAHGVFANQPNTRSRPLVESLAGVRQSGDDASVGIQRIMHALVAQSHYLTTDPDVRYVLSGGRDGS
jgi:hypothetical protein